MAHRSIAHLALAVLISGACAALALSTSAGAGVPRAERFEGACALSGAIRHEPPLTMQAATTTVNGGFAGTCSGTFTDRRGRTSQLDNAPAEYRAQGVGELSCLGGTATGAGKLLLGRKREIDFSLTERRPGPGLAVVTLKGAAGGSAIVVGTVDPQTLLEANTACGGAGLRIVRGDARIVSLGLSG